jgi:tetratricopeptide (TPR) repeat protein
MSNIFNKLYNIGHYSEQGIMTSDPTTVARSLYFEGRAVEAEGLFRKVLSERPDDVAAIEGLGVLVLQQGRAGEAVELFARGLAAQPDSARLCGNLGEALRSVGRLEEALVHLRRATELDPAFAQAWNSLGLLAHARGHFDYAETAYRECLRLRPNFAAAHVNLANALVARGRLAEAAESLRQALRIEPHHGVALMNLARVLAEARRPDADEAETLARRAVELMPHLPYALMNLGQVLRLRGRHDEAGVCFERARGLAAGHAGPSGRAGPAPAPPADSAADSHAQGLVCLKEGRLDEAETYFRAALRIDPMLAASWLALARVQQERGELEPACQSARSALAVRPKLAEAYAMLASTLGRDLADAEVRAMEALLDDPEVTAESRARLRFGLATVLDRRGSFAEAAAHFEAANALQSASKSSRGLAFDHEGGTLFVRRVIEAFTPGFLAARPGWGDPDPRPVFIVGLPRSGTTLTEQVLASHPSIHGAGELHDVAVVFRSLPELVGQPSLDPYEALGRLDLESTRIAARSYLERLAERAPASAERVVDKQPDNFNHLGLIGLCWPEARVIVCHRDPRDVAVSCWQMGLATAPWSNDWDHIARRFADHQRILEHWRQIRPLGWLDVAYENLVNDLEGQARCMIEYLGLDWDPACLEFHTNGRAVRTPSLVQVRQPVHTRSVGRWRNYEPFIQPLLAAFERHGVKIDNIKNIL